MIFNKDYDKTLCLILFGDKKNRDVMIEFIRTIPKEVYEQILSALEKQSSYEKNNISFFDRDEFCIDGAFVFANGYKYYFMLDMLLNSLTVGKYIINENSCEKDFEITLLANNTYNIEDNFSKQYLGVISSDTVKSHNVGYNLVSSFLGKIVRIYDKGGWRRIKVINPENISDDFNISDLNNNNKLVRTRKIG